MYKSQVLKRLNDGEAVWCAKTNLTDPNVVEIMGYLGIHCVWICMEHGPINLETVHHHIRAAKAGRMDSMVRVPRGSYSDLIRPLEMDATGLMVPHCMSGADVQHVVRNTRFHPQGLRPLDSGNSDGPFCMLPPLEYLRHANEQRFIVAQIEDKEAVDAMEDLLAVDGVDVYFLGPADLAQSYGVPGQYEHPLVLEAVDKLSALARQYNRHWGMPCPPEKAPKLLDKGARFLAAGSDVVAIIEKFKALRDGYKAAGLRFESEF